MRTFSSIWQQQKINLRSQVFFYSPTITLSQMLYVIEEMTVYNSAIVLFVDQSTTLSLGLIFQLKSTV